ncbi:uncharacterized protein LOC124942916 [Impatiens glandulifera]|uniref:uncharacterized protein LOC124942916 n=1 Tax=Impatiens glandulifera TaxID=253017 RepID=UPI001FB0D709|nr:uncharacterized protein LOC124942916 [Impatiens glandulifera]
MVEVKAKVDDNLFRLAIVYGSNSGSVKRLLWSCFKAKIDDGDPWAVLGDFNVTIFENERSPESEIIQDMIDFNECICDIGCVEPTNSGNLFTWSSMRGNEQIRRSRIDRGLVNLTWVAKYPRSHVHILNRGISDHCPLKLYWEKEKKVRRPFQFFKFWMENDNFKDILNEVWDTHVDGSKIFRVNISKRVMAARADIEEVQSRFLCDDIDDLLREKEKSTIAMFRELSSMEESFVRQKSRQNWISPNDKNTTFFYRKCSSRNLRNNIQRLKKDNWDFAHG